MRTSLLRRIAARATAGLILVAGCAHTVAPIELSNEWPAPAAVGDYREVTEKWTREAADRAGPDGEGRTIELTLDVIATFKSPEWRAAYVKFRADRGKLPAREVAALTAREKAESADHYEVMLMVATYDRRRNELQKSLNLALGSSLATIGLTIPTVSILALILKAPLELGVDMHDTVLLVLTFAVSIVTFGGGRTNILPGFVHLALFAIFVFLVFVP